MKGYIKYSGTVSTIQNAPSPSVASNFCITNCAFLSLCCLDIKCIPTTSNLRHSIIMSRFHAKSTYANIEFYVYVYHNF